MTCYHYLGCCSTNAISLIFSLIRLLIFQLWNLQIFSNIIINHSNCDLRPDHYSITLKWSKFGARFSKGPHYHWVEVHHSRQTLSTEPKFDKLIPRFPFPFNFELLWIFNEMFIEMQPIKHYCLGPKGNFEQTNSNVIPDWCQPVFYLQIEGCQQASRRGK